MADPKRPEDTEQFVKELTDQMDGPDLEEVEAELLKAPPSPPTCEHCKDTVDKPKDSAPEPRLLNIGEPSPFREKERGEPKKSE